MLYFPYLRSGSIMGCNLREKYSEKHGEKVILEGLNTRVT